MVASGTLVDNDIGDESLNLVNDRYDNWVHIAYGAEDGKAEANAMLTAFIAPLNLAKKRKVGTPLHHDAGLMRNLQTVGWSLGWANAGHVKETYEFTAFDKIMHNREPKMRTICDKEDAMIAWPKKILRYAPRERITLQHPSKTQEPAKNALVRFLAMSSEGSHGYNSHFVPAEYIKRIHAEHLTLHIIDTGKCPHEEWVSETGKFTFRQLRFVLGLRYCYIDANLLADWFFSHCFFDGLNRVSLYQGEPVFEPVFGS